MDIGILGPLTFRLNGREAAPAAPKMREILALLAVRANQVVPFPDIVWELWEEAPPQSAKITLQSYIVRLRQQLSARLSQDDVSFDSKSVLLTRYGGYQLQADPGSLDFRRFEELAGKGRRQLLEGDYARASLMLRSALGHWRGPAFVDVTVGPLLEAHLTRLVDARLTAAEQLMEAELRLGRHLDILGDLLELTAEHPFHENLHAQLMVALYRSSRRSQALEVFGRLRAALAEDLGLDPSPKLQRLHLAVLGGDPVLEDLRPSSGLLLDGFAA